MATTFTYSPSYGAAATRKPVVKSVRFGSGYEQRLGDGINNRPEIWDLQFTNRTATEANAIDAFLAAANGVSYFNWTTPDGTTGKFICREWTKAIAYADAYTVNARFEQVFDL